MTEYQVVTNHVVVGISYIEDTEIPMYMTGGSSGCDLRASEHVRLDPGEWRLVKTGIFLEIPEGYEAQVRPRSGLALKHGITVLNSPGTIDSDYRGEVGVILLNQGKQPFFINKGERIAQLVFAKVERPAFEQKGRLSDTDRGEGGYGSTGAK